MELNRKIFSHLKNWSQRKGRKPLILRGARQVGKTFAVLLFGRRYFPNVIHINLEKAEHRRLFPEDLSLQEFEKIVNLYFQKPLVPGKTLLFIDEIQESTSLIKLLRFFFEDKPKLHVIAAGSLFEVRVKETGFPYPVGRVEFAYLYPLDFFEFLEAKEEKKLLAFLKNFDFKEKIPRGIHQRLLELFSDYALIGGMPEAVKVYLQTKNLEEVNLVYSNLFISLKDDVYKYSSLAKSKYVSFVLEQAPLFAGLTMTYEKFAGSSFRSREISSAFETLEKAMIISQIRATKSTNLPLLPQRKKPGKLIFLDVGLVNFQMGIQAEFVRIKDLTGFYQGRIAEQLVAQQLLSSFTTRVPPLFYWYKKTGSQAEVDFSFSHQGKIWGIEVKSGSSGRLKSLFAFQKAVKKSKIIRVYAGELEQRGDLISLPFYLLPRLSEF